MPEHHRLFTEPFVQVIPPYFAVPKGMVAPGNKGHGAVIVLTGEFGQSSAVALGRGLSGECSGG